MIGVLADGGRGTVAETVPVEHPEDPPHPTRLEGPAMTARAAARRIVVAATALLGLAAVLLWTAERIAVPVGEPPLALGVLAVIGILAVLYMAAETWTADLPVRDHVISVSLVELVTAVALVFAPAGGLVLARITGGVLSQLLRTREPGRILYNAAAFALDGAVTVLVFRLVLGDAGLLEPRAWVASLVAITVGQLVLGGAVALATWLTSGPRSAAVAVRAVALGAPMILTGVAGGTSVAQLVLRDERAWWLLWTLALAWGVLLASLDLLGRRYQTLVAFHDHTAELQHVTTPTHAIEATTRAIHELLGAPWAEISTSQMDAPRASQRSDLGGWERVEAPALELAGGRLTDRAARQRGLASHAVEPLHGRSGEVVGHLVAGWHRERRVAGQAARTLATIARQAEATIRRVEVTQSLHGELLAKAHRNQRDALTDLPNTTSLVTFLQEDIRAAPGQPRAILLLSIDQFRTVKASLGHESGNAIVREVAERVKEHAPEGAYVASTGPEEFAVTLPVTDEHEARLAANVLRRHIAAPLEQTGLRLELTTTAGIALYPAHGSDPATLLHHADAALHRAREQHSGIEVHEPEEADRVRRRLRLAADLRPAIARGEVVAHYQPKLDARTGEVVGAEALARWTHPELGPVPPLEFIPLAEQTAAIHDLTLAILDQALADLGRLAREGAPLRTMSVNLSPAVLNDPGIADYVQALLERHEVEPSRLVVEFTESSVIDSGQALATIDELRLVGVQLSIDDYGTGYASMSYLHQLQASELKVDRSFVTRMASEAGFFLIVRSTIELAQNLGMRAVAEGVEDGEAWRQLRELGCDQVQGYVASRPVPFEELVAWLQGNGGRWLPDDVEVVDLT